MGSTECCLGVVPWVQISAPPRASNPGDPEGPQLFQSCRMPDAGGLDPRPRYPCLSCNTNGAATRPALPEGEYEVGASRVCCSRTDHAESDQVSRNDRAGRKPALHWLLPVLPEHWTHFGICVRLSLTDHTQVLCHVGHLEWRRVEIWEEESVVGYSGTHQ